MDSECGGKSSPHSKIAFKNSSKGIRAILTKMGIKIGLNTLVSMSVNNLIYKPTSRLMTAGGMVCLVLDALDGKVDYWFNYKKIGAYFK